MIEINPNRINVSSGNTGKLSERKREQAQQAATSVPRRAHVNIIPSNESLATLIRSAVAAFRQGVTWDRGTILNLLV